ncbi:hypothetical protein [Streptomyces sp. NPDC056337]|uniref:hypothetical protein n=1 Tax=Streptomyces sp. NPDC056337 TaxID=3345787 RepID=UPI0035D9E458
MRDLQLLRPADHVLAAAALLDEEPIRVFHGQELITTIPRVTRKEVVVRKSGEHNRGEIV